MNVKELNKPKYLFLEEINEPSDNTLRLVVSAANIGTEEKSIKIGNGSIEGVRMITPSDQCYEIVFESYVSYFVLNESWDTPYEGLKEEKWEGGNFRITSHSKFIEFLETSDISRDWVGEYKHYRIYCQNHVINIVSVNEPQIKSVVKSNIT